MMQWFAWGGLALAFSAYAVSNIPFSVYANSDFWLNGPTLIFIKLGAILMFVAFAWVWNIRATAAGWSWIRQFGMTSLLVYWVHIELVYGSWFGVLKEQLTLGQTVFAAMLTIALMLGLSLLRTNWTQVRAWFASGEGAMARSRAISYPAPDLTSCGEPRSCSFHSSASCAGRQQALRCVHARCPIRSHLQVCGAWCIAASHILRS